MKKLLYSVLIFIIVFVGCQSDESTMTTRAQISTSTSIENEQVDISIDISLDDFNGFDDMKKDIILKNFSSYRKLILESLKYDNNEFFLNQIADINIESFLNVVKSSDIYIYEFGKLYVRISNNYGDYSTFANAIFLELRKEENFELLIAVGESEFVYDDYIAYSMYLTHFDLNKDNHKGYINRSFLNRIEYFSPQIFFTENSYNYTVALNLFSSNDALYKLMNSLEFENQLYEYSIKSLYNILYEYDSEDFLSKLKKTLVIYNKEEYIEILDTIFELKIQGDSELLFNITSNIEAFYDDEEYTKKIFDYIDKNKEHFDDKTKIILAFELKDCFLNSQSYSYVYKSILFDIIKDVDINENELIYNEYLKLATNNVLSNIDKEMVYIMLGKTASDNTIKELYNELFSNAQNISVSEKILYNNILGCNSFGIEKLFYDIDISYFEYIKNFSFDVLPNSVFLKLFEELEREDILLYKRKEIYKYIAINDNQLVNEFFIGEMNKGSNELNSVIYSYYFMNQDYREDIASRLITVLVDNILGEYKVYNTYIVEYINNLGIILNDNPTVIMKNTDVSKMTSVLLDPEITEELLTIKHDILNICDKGDNVSIDDLETIIGFIPINDYYTEKALLLEKINSIVIEKDYQELVEVIYDLFIKLNKNIENATSNEILIRTFIEFDYENASKGIFEYYKKIYNTQTIGLNTCIEALTQFKYIDALNYMETSFESSLINEKSDILVNIMLMDLKTGFDLGIENYSLYPEEITNAFCNEKIELSEDYLLKIESLEENSFLKSYIQIVLNYYRGQIE